MKNRYFTNNRILKRMVVSKDIKDALHSVILRSEVIRYINNAGWFPKFKYLRIYK